MSPLEIKILIECCVSGEPGANFVGEQWNTEVADDIRNKFANDGIINIEDFSPTEKGLAWLAHICETPMPVKKWIRPE